MTHHPTPGHARLAAGGMYRPDMEADACGVGMVAATDGKAARRVVEAAIEALRAVWHRGAVDADGKTGDGAGIHVDLPERFFDDAIAASGHKVRPNRLAVGMIFLPRTDLSAQEERSEEHTSELQSLMRISYAVFCLKQKTTSNNNK